MLSGRAVFKNTFPSMVSKGWKLTDIPGLWGFNSYKNAVGPHTDVLAGIAIANTTAIDLSRDSGKPSAAASSSGMMKASTARSSAAAAASSAVNGRTQAAGSTQNGSSAASPVTRQSFFGTGVSLLVAAVAVSATL
jgi:hypothetical protein